MECACVYVDVWDGEGSTMLRGVERAARKPHKCGECRRVIMPGERYQDERLLFDGSVDTHKTCSDCMSLRREMFCDCWIYGQLWEAFGEYLLELDEDDVPWAKIGKLTATARDRALERVEQKVFVRCEEED